VTELPDVVARVLDHTIGDEELEAYAVHRVSTSIQVDTDASIRQVGHAETRGVGIRVIRDGRLGYASTSDLDPASLALSVDRARANAAAADPDEAQLLPTPQPVHRVAGLLAPELEQAKLADKIALVVDLARLVVSLDPRVAALDTAEYQDERRTVAVASTRGVRAVQQVGYVEMWADALGEDRDSRASDYAYQFGRSPADCRPEAVAAKAVQRTTRLLGPVTPRPAGLPVVLDPTVVGDLLAQVGKGLSGGPLSSGRTPFAGQHGTPVAASCVNLADHGSSPEFLAAATFDDEGVPRRLTRLIDQGVLVGAMHSSVTARAAGAAGGSTGNARRASHKSVPRAAPSCLVLAPTAPLAELMSSIDEAVYVQQLSGSGAGINAVTGRVDVGGVGWLLRRGQVLGRVETVAISTTLPDLLGSVAAVGDDSYQVPFSPTAASTVVCDGELLRPTR
jgi:PmbA protein